MSRTRGSVFTRLHASQAIAEFALCAVELLEGVGQVFEFFVELLLDLRELLGGEGVEVDWTRASAILSCRERRMHLPVSCWPDIVATAAEWMLWRAVRGQTEVGIDLATWSFR